MDRAKASGKDQDSRTAKAKLRVSGRSKCPTASEMESSHFEDLKLRRRRSSTHSLLTEANYV